MCMHMCMHMFACSFLSTPPTNLISATVAIDLIVTAGGPV